MRVCLRVILLTLCVQSPVWAQSTQLMGDPHGGSMTWQTPTPEEQAERATGLAPAATGAIFVPGMTRSSAEPKYRVFEGSKRIASALPGEKVYVTPGIYTVVVGSGAEEALLKFDVTVVEGEVTYIPVKWSGLLITVLDERGNSFRGSYELVRMPERDFVGIGLGADLAKGERLTSWYLPPGLYMILAPGESYQARRNFLTVRVRPGELTQLTLVQDESNGDILGGGELLELTTGLEVEGWDLALILGGSIAFSQTDSVVEKSDGSFVNLEAFAENVNQFNRDSHFMYTRIYLEESSREIKLPDNPYLKDDDKLELEALYSYRVRPFFGPYLRGGVETHILPSILEFDTPRDVQRVGSSGPASTIQPNRDFIYLAPPFSNVRTRLGMGGRFEGNPVSWLEAYSLFGLAARHLFTNRFFVDEDDPATSVYEIRRRGSNTLIGIEGALVVQLAITRWVLCQLEADVLAPMLSLPDRDKIGEPVIGLGSTLALRLASFASLNYVFDLERDPDLSTRSQIEHSLLLRFAYKVF